MSGLPLQIVYGGIDPALADASVADTPLLFYRWEPDLLLRAPEDFLRIDMRPSMYCLRMGDAPVESHAFTFTDSKSHNSSSLCPRWSDLRT